MEEGRRLQKVKQGTSLSQPSWTAFRLRANCPTRRFSALCSASFRLTTWMKLSHSWNGAPTAIKRPYSHPAALLRDASATKPQPAISALISEWPRQWRTSRLVGGKTVSSGSCMDKGATPSSSTPRRRRSEERRVGKEGG